MLKARTKKICSLIVAISVICQICGTYFKNPHIVLACVITQLIIVISIASFSFFSILSFCIFYSFFMEYLEFISVTGGILAMEIVPIYYYEFALCEMFLHIIFVLFFETTCILTREKLLYKSGKELSKQKLLLLSLASITIIILVFPSFPTFQKIGSEIVSFNFHIVPFVLLLATIASIKKNRWLYFVYFFVLFWTFGHAARVTALGFIVTFIVIRANNLDNNLYFKNQKSNKKAQKKYIRRLIPIIIALIVTLIVIGGIRGHGGISYIKYMTPEIILRSIFVQGTSCDVAYVFNCCVDLAKSGNQVNGITLLTYIIELIPFIKDPYIAGSVIQRNYYTVGGMPIFGEPIMNFGMWSIIPWILIIMFLLNWILKKNSEYRYYIWINIFAVVFRIVWYGIYYPYTQVFWLVPAVYIFTNNGKIRRNRI